MLKIFNSSAPTTLPPTSIHSAPISPGNLASSRAGRGVGRSIGVSVGAGRGLAAFVRCRPGRAAFVRCRQGRAAGWPRSFGVRCRPERGAFVRCRQGRGAGEPRSFGFRCRGGPRAGRVRSGAVLLRCSFLGIVFPAGNGCLVGQTGHHSDANVHYLWRI